MSDQSSSAKLCVVGLGARTPVGLRALPTGAAIRAGVSRVREHPFMVDKAGEPFRVARDSILEDEERTPRMLSLARSALDEVLVDLPLSPSTRISIFLALPEIGPHFSDRAASDLCARLTASLASRCQVHVHPITEGNAAGALALEKARALIEADPTAFCVVGGVDSFIDPGMLEALDAAGRVASTSNRWGFPPGEGAGMLAVCGTVGARQLRLRPLAMVAAIAVTEEPNRLGSRSTCLGIGLSAAMVQAAARAPGPISLQYCDINGERYREHELSYAILRLPTSAFVNAVDYVAPADRWGNVGAASIPLLMLVPIVCHLRGASPGPRPLIWSGSENGRRGAVALLLEERTS